MLQVFAYLISLSLHPLTSALQPSSPYLQFQRRSNATQIPYGFDGNPDTYGVGIRLGYYTQVLSVWAANLWVPREAHFLHSVNILFVIAIIFGIGYLFCDPANIYAVKPYMLLQISYSIAYTGTKDFQEVFICHRLMRDLSFLGVNGYSFYFWWGGADKMMPTPGPQGRALQRGSSPNMTFMVG